MSGASFHNVIATRERLSFAADNGPPHLRALYVAARDYGVRLGTVSQNTGRFDPPDDKPVVLTLGDDMHAALGPAAFHRKSVRRFAARAGLVVIVSCAPLVPLYAAAGAMAAMMRRDVLLIESQPRWEQAWIDLVQAAHPGVQTLIGAVRPETESRH